MFAFTKLAFRNLCRHKRRSVLTGFIIGIGTLNMVLSFAFSQSVSQRMIEAITRGYTGNIQIHAPMNEKIEILGPPNDALVFGEVNRVQRLLGRSKSVKAVAPRIRLAGLLSKDDNSYGVMVTAIDPDLEPQVTPKIKVLKGAYLTGSQGILLGKTMAKNAELQVGDEVILMAGNQDGYLNAFPFKVQGIVSHEGMGMFLDYIAYININTARQLLYYNQNEALELAISLKKGVNEKKAINDIQAQLDGAGIKLQVNSWQDVAGIISGIVMGMKVMPQIMTFILLLAVAFGIINTILMSVLERTREIGTMMALGTKSSEIRKLLLLESGVLSAIAAGIGCIIGTGIIYWLSRTGIPAPVEAMEFIFGGRRLYYILDWSGVVISFFITIGLSLLVTFFPTHHATNLKPAEALREY